MFEEEPEIKGDTCNYIIIATTGLDKKSVLSDGERTHWLEKM